MSNHAADLALRRGASMKKPGLGVLPAGLFVGWNVASLSNSLKGSVGSTQPSLSRNNCLTGGTIVARVRSGVKGFSPQ